MDPKAVTNTTEWRPSTQQGGSTTAHHKNGIATTTAVQFQTTPQSWCKLVARHMKLVDFLGDGGNTENENGNKSGGVFAWAGAQGCGTDRVPFHPLHGAASQGLAGAGRRILEAGCCGNLDQASSYDIVNVLDAAGRSPLHWAAVTDRVEFVRLLLEYGADVDIRDCAGRTPLFGASAFGAVATVRILLEEKACKDGEDDRGLTPLHAASAGGHVEVIQELLSARADRRRRCSAGATPRHVAERQGHHDVVKMLTAATSWGSGGGDDGLPNDASFFAQHKYSWQSAMLRAE